MYRVLVLLSTYNGEKYLSDQILSILSQNGVDISILVRDDGSSDRTKEILKDFESNHSNIHVSWGKNLGFVGSFTELVEMAVKGEAYDYYAFSDQDDVWCPQKMRVACEQLSELPNDLPCLFSSNSQYVDEHLNPLGLFHPSEPYRTKQNVMLYATEQGCSMVFNRKAIEYYQAHPPVITCHDRWMCLICNCFGEMKYCQTPLFYYRIHGGNALGKVNKTLWQRIFGDLKLLVKYQESENLSMVKEFYHAWKMTIDNNTRECLETYIYYPNNLKNKFKILFFMDYQHSLSLWDRIRKAILVLCNKL